MDTLTQQIKARALDLGFDLVGVAPVSNAPNADAYEAWLARGYQGEMSYMARNVEKRRYPGHVLSGAKSLVAVALNYKQPNDDSLVNSPSHGRIAQYARGIDYHDLMKDRLDSLLLSINELADDPVRGKVYVDTGPVLERDFAVLAGLGWYGKHTNLINRNMGSWFLIGEILIDLELSYDEKVTDHCGTCTLCIEACPTDAITEPYVVDARRCISYLTIELKGAIPVQFRTELGNHVFGCDDCQDVCPWNRRAPEAQEPAFKATHFTDHPSLVHLLRMTADDFRANFKGSPIKRTKRRGLLRNVAIALGNSNDTAVVQPLIAALEDEEPLVRQHAAWALGRLRTQEAHGALIQASAVEQDADVLVQINLAISEYP